MFCTKCGAQINDGAMFCPSCGNSIRAAKPIKENKNSSSILAGKMKMVIIILAILIIVPILVVRSARKAELAIVKSTAEKYMDMVKYGPDTETMNEIVDQLIYESVPYETVASFLADRINGEDVQDVYSVIMRYMDYSVTNVEKIEPEHYQVTISVSNLNNMTVGAETLKYFISRYTGGGKIGAILQAIEDLSSDKSQTVASLMGEVSDYIYSQNDPSCFVTGEYVIDVKKVDGEWSPSSEQGLDNFIMNCAGINTN